MKDQSRRRLSGAVALVVISGTLIIAGGFAYDVIFAGIPYQDPTPAMQARYDFHANVASTLYRVGILAVSAGGMAAVILAIVSRLVAREAE
jgi:hypothetical protein